MAYFKGESLLDCGSRPVVPNMENKWEKWEVKKQRNMPCSTRNGMGRRVVKKVKKNEAVTGEGMGRRIHQANRGGVL